MSILWPLVLASAPNAVAAVRESPAATAPTPAPDPAPAATETEFARLLTLVGVWRPADNPKSPLRIRFYLTAGGTVLVEEWTGNGAPHSLTLYHRDGQTLIATHYCPQGNQPRLAMVPNAASTSLTFTFRDATDLDVDESVQHDLAFDFTDPARPVRSEIYRDGAKDEPSQLILMRAE